MSFVSSSCISAVGTVPNCCTMEARKYEAQHCNKCHKYGHISKQCMNPTLLAQEYGELTLPDQLFVEYSANCDPVSHGVTKCRVPDCQSSNTHTARYHTCRLCAQIGHGETICGKPSALHEYMKACGGDFIPNNRACTRCANTGDAYTHTADGHTDTIRPSMLTRAQRAVTSPRIPMRAEAHVDMPVRDPDPRITEQLLPSPGLQGLVETQNSHHGDDDNDAASQALIQQLQAEDNRWAEEKRLAEAASLKLAHDLELESAQLAPGGVTPPPHLADGSTSSNSAGSTISSGGDPPNGPCKTMQCPKCKGKSVVTDENTCDNFRTGNLPTEWKAMLEVFHTYQVPAPLACGFCNQRYADYTCTSCQYLSCCNLCAKTYARMP